MTPYRTRVELSIAAPDEATFIRGLRELLKRLLRDYGVRCLSIRPMEEPLE